MPEVGVGCEMDISMHWRFGRSALAWHRHHLVWFDVWCSVSNAWWKMSWCGVRLLKMKVVDEIGRENLALFGVVTRFDDHLRVLSVVMRLDEAYHAAT